MYSIAYKILHNHNDTEDAIQDALIKIHLNIEKFYKLQTDELCLLIVIYTKNTAKDLYKRSSKRQTISLTYDEDGEERDFEILDESPDLDEIVINRERVQKMEGLRVEFYSCQRYSVSGCFECNGLRSFRS